MQDWYIGTLLYHSMEQFDPLLPFVDSTALDAWL